MAVLSKASQSARARKLVAGANQHLSNVSSLTLNNVPYVLSAVLQLFTSFADAFDSAQAAKATYQEKLKARRVLTNTIREIEAAFIAYVRATFGSSPEVLNDFGLSPRKVATPQTAEQKALAVAKRKATRDARHTLGKREKLAIKGTAATPAAPATAASAPAPSNGSQAHGPGTP